MSKLATPAVSLLLAAALCASCQSEQVTHASVPKERARTAELALPLLGDPGGRPDAGAVRSGAPIGGAPMGGAPMGGSPMGEGAVPPPPAPEGPGALGWTLPKGWTESRPGGMRYATLTAPVQGKLDISVVVLAGQAGGELGNVNRWRGQIGLGPIDEATLMGLRRTVKSKAGAVLLYDFLGAGTIKSRLVTGLLVTGDGNTWFVKMVGDERAVGLAAAGFLTLLESLHLG